MRLSTGRWVSGGDFFNRERELQILEMRARDRNHVLLTGQRRMGKTSIAQELGRRLETEGWVFLFYSPMSRERPARRTRSRISQRPCILSARSRRALPPG